MANMVKVSALVPDELRQRAKLKALRERVFLSSVIRDFLEEWAGDVEEVQTPAERGRGEPLPAGSLDDEDVSGHRV